jgi:hypothetical protein
MSNNDARIDLSARDNTAAAFSKARAGLQSISSQLEATRTQLATVVKGFVGFKAVIEPAIALVREFAVAGLENADQLGKLAERTGINVETLSRLRVAAKLADADLNQIGAAAKHLSSTMLDAATGSKEAQTLLKAVGITVKDDLGTALEKAGTLIAGLPAGWEKNALSLALFKKGGDELIPFFNSLKEGTARAKQLNLTIGDGTAASAQRFNDNLTVLHLQLERLALGIADESLPALNAFLEAMQEGLARGGLSGAIDVALNEFQKLGGMLGFIAGLLRDHGRAVLNLAAIYVGLKITASLRAAVLAHLDLARAGLAGIAASVRETAARTAAARVTVAQAEAARIHTAILLAEAEATVAASSGMARLSLVQNLLIPRQRAAAAAAAAATAAQTALAGATGAAATASTVAGRAIALLGGPIGAVITILGLAATAWAVFGSSAKNASRKSREAVDEALQQAERMKAVRIGGEFAPVINAEQEAIAQLREQRRRLADEQVTQPTGEFDIGGAAVGRDDLARLDAEIQHRETKLAALRELNAEQRAESETAKVEGGVSPELQKLLNSLKEGKAPDLSAKRLALVRAQAEAEFTLLKTQLDESLKAYDFALEQNLISVSQHAQARLAIVTRELDAEKAAKLRELDQAKQNALSKDQEKALDARVKVKQLEGEIAAIEQKRQAAASDATREQTKGEKALADELRNVRDELDGILHNLSPEQRRAAIAAQLQPMLDKFRAAGNKEGEQGVLKLIDARATAAELQDVDKQVSALLDNLSEREHSLQLQIDAGLLTETEGRRQVISLHQQTGAELQKLLPDYERLATALDTPEAKLAFERFKNRIAELKTIVDEVAKSIDDSIKNSLGTLLDDLANRTKTNSQAMHDWSQSVLKSFTSIITKRLGERLFDSLFSKGSGLGAFGSWLVGLGSGKAQGGPINRADGGPVIGPGTETSDSIPAIGPQGVLYWLSNNEWIMRAAAVRHYGSAFMNGINNLTVSRAPKLGYAGGGAIGTTPARATSQAQQAAAAPPVVLQVHPDALHMTLSDWFQGELARTAARR